MSHEESLRRALIGRYTIERELGRGGNAVVYLAHDLKHNRKVALKVLNPELALSVRTERFLREIQIAARLSHPHILTVFDSGQAGESLFYVMPYVEGESLRDRLKRERQVPVDVTLAIAKDVADALGYAHKQGIVHRDIKPENILLHEGHAVVMDFGIARALSVASGEGVTEGGIAVGTPAYMSPEQGSGEEVDGRSDLYSLGCVLYEMLAGHVPFAGATAREILARHSMDPVPALSAARHGVPRGIEQAVARALAKEPADRFRTATQFVEALGAGGSEPWRFNRGAAYAALGAVVLLGAARVASRRLTRARPESELSVAVLPCRNISTDAENEYFSDGLTEELIDALTHIEGLRVPASTSSFWFKGKTPEIEEVGRKLDVGYFVDCSARKVGSVIRVSVQLIKVSDGFHVWSQQYERELKSAREVFAIQDSVARAVVSVLRVRLAPYPSPRLVERRAVDPGAHDLYLKGRFFYRKGTPQGNAKAIEQFRAAIARDSSYALAYSGLAEAYYDARRLGFLPRAEATLQLKAAASKAMTLDSTLAEVHNALARSYQADWDMTAASRESHQAITLNPDYVFAHITYATVLGNLGRMDEAVREVRIVTRLDPLVVETITGNILTRAHLYDEATAEFRRNLELEPDNPAMRANFGRALVNAGKFKEAIPEILRAFELRAGGDRAVKGWLSYAYARADRREDALKLLKELEDRSKQPITGRTIGSAWPGLAYACLGVGRPDCALHAIEQAIETRNSNFGWWLDPVFDSLRSNPRYQRAMQRAAIPTNY